MVTIIPVTEGKKIARSIVKDVSSRAATYQNAPPPPPTIAQSKAENT